jgi:hypothetical protein
MMHEYKVILKNGESFNVNIDIAEIGKILYLWKKHNQKFNSFVDSSIELPDEQGVVFLCDISAIAKVRYAHTLPIVNLCEDK